MFKLSCLLVIYIFSTCACFEYSGNFFQYVDSSFGREELVVDNVTAQDIFSLKNAVTKWKGITIGLTSYCVGLARNGLEVSSWGLNENRSKFIRKTTIFVALENMPKDVLLFHNRRYGKSEIVIIVSYNNSSAIEWYSLADNTYKNMWSWKLDDPINSISYFKMAGQNILFVITNAGLGLLYAFNIREEPYERWLLQPLRLGSADSSVFSHYRGNYYLSVLQTNKDQILIFKYESTRFRNHTLIQSTNVSSMVSFYIGSKTFLAINGYSAGIFEFSKTGVTRRIIENSNLDGITQWLVVPIDTYRNDVLLIAERNVDHATHRTFEVDVFTYNNNKFEEHEDIPCLLFGEHTSRLTCLTNQRQNFEYGYISILNKIALLVPQSDNDVILFFVNSRIKQVQDPRRKELDELLEFKKTIEMRIDEQNELLTKQSKTISQQKMRDANPTVGATENPQDISSYLQELKYIETEIIKLSEQVNHVTKNDGNSKFGTIIINGNADFKNPIANKMEAQNINQRNASEVLVDIVRKDNITNILNNKTFSELAIVEDLNANFINGINATSIVFANKPFTVDGNITFKAPVSLNNLNVTNRMWNDMYLENEALLLTDDHEGNLELQEITLKDKLKAAKVKSSNPTRLNTNARNSFDESQNVTEPSSLKDLHLRKNLRITSINGINFTDFYQSLCLVNTFCFIHGEIKVNGVLNATRVVADNLNGLVFRREYVFNNSEAQVNITGKKILKKTLKTSKLRSTSPINNVDTRDIISTSLPQNLGNKTFKQITLTNILQVDGELVGQLAEKFLSNPSLEETDRLNCSVEFKNLEVNGDIYLSNKFLGHNYSQLLRSILYKDEPTATITATKNFSSGLKVPELTIQSNFINNVNLSSILSQDRDQTLKIDMLKGKIFIDHLFLNGTFDGKNITEFDESLVKLTGEQYIDATLFFDNLDIKKSLEIKEKVNDIGPEEFLYTPDGGTIEERTNFGNISVENLTVKGNIRGDISGFNAQVFSKTYFSATKNQTIKSNFTLNSATVDKLTSKMMNGDVNNIPYDDESFNHNIRQALNLEKIKVENLHIEESVEFNKVNNNSVETILPLGIGNRFNNNTKRNLTLENDLLVPSIEIKKLSSMDWDDFVKQVVFKNESNIVFSGNKTFEKGITVDKLIETEKLNDVILEDILTKEKNQTIKGPLHIQGNVNFDKVHLKENLNGVSVTDTLKFISFSNGSYHVASDMIFSRLAYIKSLNIKGCINDKDIKSIFENLAFKNKDIRLTNDTVFKEPLHIKRNLAVSGFINHINFSDVYSKIVLTTSDTKINSVVRFKKEVLVREKLIVGRDLSTGLLAECNTTEWVEKSIPLDRGLIKGHYRFEHMVINDKLITDFINDIDMKHIIPLGTDQTIEYLNIKSLNFVNDIYVGEKVNGLHLPVEVGRTLTVDTDQEVSPITKFNLILIYKNLQTSRLNNQETSKIVTTNTDQNLTAIYNFDSKCVVENNLEVDGFIDGINLNDWKNKTLKLSSENTQFVCNDWKMENLTFVENLESFNNINDLNFTGISNEVKARKDFKFQLENGTLTDYKRICQDVTSFYEKAQSQVYKFKYFEKLQQLSFPTNIKTVYTFIYKNITYLLVNKEDCLTHINMFDGSSFVPFSVNISTGDFEQVVSTWDDDVVFLVTRGSMESKCSNTKGVNIWTFDESGLELKFTLENQQLLQESKIPSTFYVLGKEGVIEYKVKKNSESPRRYRRWDIFDKNAAFMPRGLKTNLAIRTGKSLIFLERKNPPDEDIDSNIISEFVIKGETKTEDNNFIPGRNGEDIAVLTVGRKTARNNLLAVATHEETVVRNAADFVKIYDDPFVGKLFDKISTYRPSSLLALEFNQGETLLLFMENKRILQVYEYKGIQGFEKRASIKLQASSLFQMNLSVKGHLNTRKVVGAVNRNQINLLMSVMDGNVISDDLNCGL